MEQIVEFGYFAEQFPSCFHATILVKHLDEILNLVDIGANQVKKGTNATLPMTLSTYKNDISRRVLSLPNPKSFLRVCKLMQENWDKILEITESENSLSAITYIHVYKYGEKAMLNSENVRERIGSKSAFIESIKNRIRASLGYKYSLQVDISKCYYSIYTHSVAWAVCGKENAKKYLRTKQPQTLKQLYDFSDKLDAFVRFQKNNETNGIVVGPFTSRIFSEIILAAIDRKLMERGFVFRRYVDDYKFFFRTEIQAQESLAIIEKILNEYGLNMNTEKTTINKYPYEIISNMREAFEAVQKKEGVFGVLNAAAFYHSKGEKGAYKYALKLIRKKKPAKDDDMGMIISSLVNIMLLEPKYGKYIIDYLGKYTDTWSKDTVTALINNELLCSLQNELQQETLLFAQIIKELKLDITAKNIITILQSENDFAIIIALDIWKSRNKNVIRTRSEAKDIKKAINKLATELNGEEYSGARWLLLHEIKLRKWFDTSSFPKPTQDMFFDKLIALKITFYKGIGKKLY